MIKLMKAAKRLGNFLADNVVRSIEGFPYQKHIIRREQNKINAICKFIGTCYPADFVFLKKFVEESICEFRELREVEIEKSYRPGHARLDTDAFINLTNIKVPNDIALILGFGPKFCFPPRNNLENTISFLDDFCASLEYSFPLETHNEAYKQLSIEISKDSYHCAPTQVVWLDFLNYRMSKFKKLHPKTLIMRSDKGKHTVLIDKSEYVEKMNNLVLFTDDYVRIDSVNLTLLERKNNAFAHLLTKSGTILCKSEYLDSCTSLARMYGLIKIHKRNYPVRPITSACGSPGFKLAKLFTGMLSETFFEQGFHVKNSLEFVEMTENVVVEDDEIMISFDVISMFTNIPIDHMITLIKTRAQAFFLKYNIDFKLLERILIFLLRECAVFQWNNLTYRQKDSLAMGSPLSPILAKILMNDIINCVLPKLNFKPKLLALYVDDSFWVVKKSEVDRILSLLNDYHPKIKFTVEKESNKRINFLDITIIRGNSGLVTNWYKKPFASSRLLNYFSHHEKACISETAAAYVRMVLNLSNADFFVQNRRILIDILRLNSFPETEIIGIMHDNYTLMRKLISKERYTGKYVPIKYRGRLTQRLKQKIHPFLCNARLVGVPDRVDSTHFSHIKDPISMNNKSNVVILFTCKCDSKHILRYTKYGTRVGNLVDGVLGRHGGDLGCSANVHYFEKIRCFQRKNFSSTKRTFDMFAYAYRNSLIDTHFSLPAFRLTRIINKKKAFYVGQNRFN